MLASCNAFINHAHRQDLKEMEGTFTVTLRNRKGPRKKLCQYKVPQKYMF